MYTKMEAAQLLYLVGWKSAFISEVILWVDDVLIGLLDATPGVVVLPSVIGTPNAIGLNDAVGEAGAPVSAVLVDDSQRARPVTVDHKLLTHDRHFFEAEGRLEKLVGGTGGPANSGASIRPWACLCPFE